MAQLMLVNPKKRKKRGVKKNTMATRKRRTAAQKRATAKLVAFNRRRKAAKRNPATKRKPRKRPIGTRQYAKSQRTKRTPTKRLRARRRANTQRGYYPNPRTRAGMVQNIIARQLQPAAIQAGGAIGLDVIYGYFGNFIPAQLNQGMLRHVTKGVVALGMGFVVSNFVKNATANEMSKGALTVVMHDAFKEALTQWMPAIPLGDVGYYNPSPVYEPQSQNMGYFETETGSGYAQNALGYFSQDAGAGYATVNRRAEADLFDTADI
jgi:hypothetical protein